jgi:predicted PurR-regulated permease PerM
METWLQQNYDIDDGMKANYINKYVNTMERAIGFTVAGSFEVLIFVTLSVFFVFYMLLYRELLRNFILLFFNQANKERVSAIASMLNTTIVNYIKGLLTEMGILILLSSITLLILGVKYAILMAFVAGILNIIPYIGIYTATLLNMLITITDGSGKQSIEVLLVFVIIHIIDANLITPFIVGGRIKINPLVTLIAVVAGKMIWGIPGMFLFIPLAAIIKIIIEKTTGLQTDKISN